MQARPRIDRNCRLLDLRRIAVPQGISGQYFLGNVVTSRINRDRIDFRGSSPVAVEQPDLVVSKDAWFRPVDLKTGPDGGIYVADFYNRIIGHYEVPLTHPGRDRFRGRIWRVVADKDVLPNPSKEGDLTNLSTESLISLWGIPRGISPFGQAMFCLVKSWVKKPNDLRRVSSSLEHRQGSPHHPSPNHGPLDRQPSTGSK